MLGQLKANLQQAETKMKKYVDQQRTEREFAIGDMVYLKMQPYRMASFGLRQAIKLATKYYGPFKILQKIGHVAYKLLLPDEVKIHHVFHVRQLKKHHGKLVVPMPNLPLVGPDGTIKREPIVVLETRSLPRNGILIAQWMIEWENLTPEDTSWEDADFIKRVFPTFFANTIQSWFPEKHTRGQV